jgi:hypothetical protein
MLLLRWWINDRLSDFYLVDVSSRQPDLKRRPGLTAWRPSVDREITTSYETYQDFLNSPHVQGNTKLTEGHWPPKDPESLNLGRWSVCASLHPVTNNLQNPQLEDISPSPRFRWFFRCRAREKDARWGCRRQRQVCVARCSLPENWD